MIAAGQGPSVFTEGGLGGRRGSRYSRVPCSAAMSLTATFSAYWLAFPVGKCSMGARFSGVVEGGVAGGVEGAAAGVTRGAVAAAVALAGGGLASGSYNGPIWPQPASNSAVVNANAATENAWPCSVGKAGDYNLR